jgi:Ca-activated chloride channel family protein
MNSNRMRQNRDFLWLAFLLIIVAALLLPDVVRAGQNNPPPLVLPRSQGQSSTLELPATPNQQGQSLNIEPQMPAPQQQMPAPQQQELTIPSQQLRQQPGYEQVTVTVTKPDGGYETGLQKDDFKLYLNGQQRPIQFFRSDLNTPVSVGILVDTSGSMVPKIQAARLAIFDFVKLLNPRDDIFLMAFSSRPYLLQSFTTNHDAIVEKLKYLYPSGQTALFDVLFNGLQTVEKGRYDKKALLVITDGDDTASRSRVEDVINAARKLGVLVYSIGIGDPNPSFGTLAIGPIVVGGDHVDAKTLNILSTETGARTYIFPTVNDGTALRTACQEISRELREQYTVGFVAPDPGSGGYRSVKVDAPGHPGDEVRVRKGVDVSGPSAYASGAGAPVP